MTARRRCFGARTGTGVPVRDFLLEERTCQGSPASWRFAIIDIAIISPEFERPAKGFGPNT